MFKFFLLHFFLVVLLTEFHYLGAKNVFLFIGDGMGIAQRTLAEFVVNSRETKQPGIHKLTMNKLPVQGYLHTYSSDSYITDSAAGATTYAMGKKTYSGAIGLDKDGKNSGPTLVDVARKHGMKTGIITNVPLNHATPGAFYAHEINRRMYNQIADSLVQAPLDFVGGGCIKVTNLPGGSKTPQDYYALAKQNGFKFHANSLDSFKPQTNERDWVMPDDCSSGGDIPYAIDRSELNRTVLKDYVSMGIRSLENPKGFFLMVEGGKIDWAAHSNDAATTALEVIDFDEAIHVALDFYEKNPDDTTIIIVADHETGGLSLGRSETKYELFPEQLLHQKISMNELNNIIKKWRDSKPAFDVVLQTLKTYFTFADWDETVIARVRKAYEYTFDPELKDKVPQKFMYSSSEPLAIAMIDLIAEKAGIAWTTVAHTAVPVTISAVGVGQHMFGGMNENTIVFKNLKSIIEKN